ncbi:type II CRISPR RNA-guided endonuclease Cas9 [Adlercreutzia sp. ZJ304]|uniref:type II CRISPR RNA-guided endonuclease Cas9 n=1 Tax=Adlercreutzia sp. ZJ304 TaxID=2709791 RepID=UPI0013E9C7BA|nr:type II CRISPR RNA-guided endonuclease Cas9 [Adlercreutzia sp. ZJ304]
MNLRNVGEYNIGLDIGTASVGWAAVDHKGDLCYFNGKPTWGSRIFLQADKASSARVHRGQRRRYDRRRWRLNLLQEIFEEEINQVDPEFFYRLKQSRLLKEDRDAAHSDYIWLLFNDKDFTEKDYYDKFPTIYHLRKWLMETNEKADIRLIYLAFHNIVKHRGNFLQQDNPTLTSKNADVDNSVKQLCVAVQNWCELNNIDCFAEENIDKIIDVLKRTNAHKSELKEAIWSLFNIQPNEIFSKKQSSDMSKAIAGAIVGASAEMAHIFFIAGEKPADVKTKIYLSSDEDIEAFENICPDDGIDLFKAMQGVYSSFVLQEILSLRRGKSISVNKVAEYEIYGENLKTLKSLAREYISKKEYSRFFRGPLYPKLYPGEKAKYDISEASGYTKYNAVHGRSSYDDFRKEVENLFADTPAIDDIRYIEMMDAFKEERFLRRLKTSDNGAIPFQLHLEEMDEIIEIQKKFYPFLESKKRELDSLVTFRIPYYVGPLTQKNARRVNDKEDGNLRFAWSERLRGKENEKIYPWNWEQVIDKNASAEKFITRMTGTCTYLQGEPVLPKCSLLYEEFCVLNELNGAHYSEDGDKEYRFDYRDRTDMVDELFKNGSATYKKIADWMNKRSGHMNVHVSGAQGERGFESRLSSYIFFKKDIFKVDEIPQSDYPMIEEIILWNTIFEDRDILRQKLYEKYGDRLNDEQIKKICQKRFTGWGKLSRKFLTEIKAQTDNGPYSIMDVLREGDPNNGHGGKAMVLMEALRDDKLQFQKLVDVENEKKFGDIATLALEELPGSPALRRGINQALGIIREIVKIAGHAPANIFVEVTRSDDERKGQRTKRRYDDLKEHIKAFKKQNPEFVKDALEKELATKGHADLNEKLTLYFMQGGKSLYSGKPLDINRLSEYEVDHILPQSYIKDDSFENKALVFKEENQRKSDQMLLPADMRREMKPYWDALYGANLIGEKKYKNLLRAEIHEKQLKGFINRQIVETSQIVKIVQMMLEGMLPETDVLSVKAGLSHELRERNGFVKCREINDFHHAHDALLTCQIGRFIKLRYPDMYEHPLKYQHVIRKFVKNESERVKRGHAPFNSSFLISSFMKSGFDKDTGEILDKGDTWNADAELDRIRKYLNYKQCYVTRMPEETSGAFWDETIYSPHDSKKANQLKLPLKKGLDPKKYGSYSREQFAYFFIYEAVKKDKSVLELASVPVSVAASLKSDESALEEYARAICEESGTEFSRIIRSKVLKYQLMDVDGSRLYVTGKKEVRNAVAVAFSLEEVAIAKRIVDEREGKIVESVTDEEVWQLFNRVKNSLMKYSPRLSDAVKISKWDEEFSKANLDDKKQVVMNLAAIAAGKVNMIDLSVVGGGKCVGCMRLAYSKVFSQSEVYLVDQSITGMFERRTRIGF